MTVQLTYSQHRAFVELPSKSLEELQDMFEKAKEKQVYYDSVSKEILESDYSIESQINDHYMFMHDIKSEIVRQEEKMNEKTNAELEELAKSSARRVKQMENYEWDAVENSSAENQRGFMEHLSYLEKLESVAYFELQRREFGFVKDYPK